MDLINSQLLTGRAVAVRGATRYALSLAIALNVLLFVGLVASNFAWMRHADRLAAKQWIVFEAGADGTRARDAAELQSPPLPIEARARAWEIVRLVLGADSSAENAAAANFKKARALMTPKLSEEFDRAVAPTAADLANMQVVRTLQADPQNVRPIEAAELPPDRSLDAPGFHMLVKGKLAAYRIGNNEPLLAGNFAYYVNLIPDVRGRSVSNPSGLLVAAMVPVAPAPAPPQPGKDSLHAPQ
jgi:hypothetical protein